MDLIERNRFWKTKLNEKLQEQRKSLEGKGLEFCTFRPNLNKVKHLVTRIIIFR